MVAACANAAGELAKLDASLSKLERAPAEGRIGRSAAPDPEETSRWFTGKLSGIVIINGQSFPATNISLTPRRVVK